MAPKYVVSNPTHVPNSDRNHMRSYYHHNTSFGRLDVDRGQSTCGRGLVRQRLCVFHWHDKAFHHRWVFHRRLPFQRSDLYRRGIFDPFAADSFIFQRHITLFWAA